MLSTAHLLLSGLILGVQVLDLAPAHIDMVTRIVIDPGRRRQGPTTAGLGRGPAGERRRPRLVGSSGHPHHELLVTDLASAPPVVISVAMACDGRIGVGLDTSGAAVLDISGVDALLVSWVEVPACQSVVSAVASRLRSSNRSPTSLSPRAVSALTFSGLTSSIK
jgi:hypothetical protein